MRSVATPRLKLLGGCASRNGIARTVYARRLRLLSATLSSADAAILATAVGRLAAVSRAPFYF